MTAARVRLDAELVRRGLARSREQAAELVAAGLVTVAGQRAAKPDDPPADIRLTASSDDVIALSATPANIARMWLSGRVKVQASMRDLLALRKLL